MIGSDGEVIRIVGTLADVTDAKTAEERLLHDAVHDNLTGLPNRQLFYDRLEAALTFASQDDGVRPTVLVIDIDRFKQVNETVGYSAGDSILLTLSRRLGRLLKPQDTLARDRRRRVRDDPAFRARAGPDHRLRRHDPARRRRRRSPMPSARCS